MDNLHDSLQHTVKTHWRSFVPIWLFPVIFFGSWVAMNKFDYPNAIFWLVDTPYFYWSFYRATKLWMRKEVKYSHYTFLTMVLPFIIWVVLVYSNIGFWGISESDVIATPYASTSKFSISALKFIFFVVSFAMQGLMLPFSLFCIYKNRSLKSYIWFLASTAIAISSFIVITILPDQDHNLRFSDFNSGYLKVTHNTKPYYYIVIAGFCLYSVCCVIKGIEVGISYYRSNKQS